MAGEAGLPVATGALVAGALVATVGAPPWPALGVAALVAAAAGAASRRARPAAMLALVAFTAFGLGAARSHAVRYPRLPPDHVAHLELPARTTLVGRIAAPPEHRRRQSLLVVEAETVGGRPARGRVRVSVRRPGRRWRWGDRLRVETTLRLPRNFENPGRFDWVAHLGRQGIHVTAFVWDAGAVRRLPGGPGGVRALLERWRSDVARRITAAIPAPHAAVLRALVLGDQGGIPARLRDAFTRAGVVHVLSVSGLHVTLVAAGAYWLLRRALGRSERLLLTAAVEPIAAGLALVPVGLYAALAGLGIPVLRASGMVAAVAAGRALGRRVDPLRALALAALGLTLAFPAAPLDVGFQLSFASVAAIVWGVRALAPVGPPWRRAVLVSPCALAGTAPLTALHFGQVSLVGLAANAAVVPIFGSAVVLPGLLGALLTPLAPAAASLAFALAGRVVAAGGRVVEAFAAVPGAALEVPEPSLGTVAGLYAALGAALVRGRGRRALAAIAVVTLLAQGAAHAAAALGERPLRVTFLDVGQGDAAVVELPTGGTLVVDAGGFPGSEFDTGEAVVWPYLRHRGILRPDAVVMTHAHPDHSGGLGALLRRRPREFWWTGVPGRGEAWRRLADAVAASGARVRVLADASPLPGFAAGVAVLHPVPETGGLSLNDTSLTLRVAAGGGVLLTGDIEAAAESRLLARPARLASRVLKVPHHGSRTSSAPAFVAAVRPAIAVVSVGTDNRYRLPAAAVEARYRDAGACVLRTDRCGAVTVTSDARGLRVRTERPGCGCPP